jgi:regulatory protein NPR1
MSDGFAVLHQQNGTPDEQKVKKMRLGELKEDVRKAYNKDTADNSVYSVLSSNSSSSPPQMAAKK